MTKNRVVITEEGVVEIHVVGDQTVASIIAMGERAFELSRQQRAQGVPALILDNLFEIGSVPAEGRKQVVELIKSTAYDRLAMIGTGAALRLGANLMLQATGKGNRVKYFDSRDKALAWLLKPL